MKRNIIRYGMIVLLIGLIALAASRANAQGSHRNEIHIESYSWGLSSGQTARVSMANFGDGSVRFLSESISANDPLIARIQILDTEGEVIAQSGEIKVEPGQTRFWDVPRDRLPAGEPNGRIQVRTRILITTKSFDLDRNRPPLAPTMELIDPSTGRTSVLMATQAFFVGGVLSIP